GRRRSRRTARRRSAGSRPPERRLRAAPTASSRPCPARGRPRRAGPGTRARRAPSRLRRRSAPGRPGPPAPPSTCSFAGDSMRSPTRLRKDRGIRGGPPGLTRVVKHASRLLPALLASLLLVSCASGGSRKPDSGLGTRVLDCTVVNREHDASGSGSGSAARGTGSYYIVFQTREGQATSTYRFEVTRQQYQRYQEGDRVKLTLNNNILVNIQPIND